MRTKVFQILIVALLVASSAATTALPVQAQSTLLYSENFSGTSLPSTWYPCPIWWSLTGSGLGGNEPCGRTDQGVGAQAWFVPSAITVPGDGYMHLTASKRNTVISYDGLTFPYNSGYAITGKQTSGWYTYGYFEARFKCPAMLGGWCAFWMWADPNSSSEIDITETLGSEPYTHNMNLHGAATFSKAYQMATSNNQWHTYAVDWQPGYIKWYLDDILVATYTGTAFNNDSLYLILSYQLGGDWAGPVDESKLPIDMLVDFVNVYDVRPGTSTTSYTISGNAGVAGATLSYMDGTQKTATSDSSGNYSFQVPANWSGTVTPSKTGVTFTPANRTYTGVAANMTAQNYTLAVTYFTISGNAGVAGATLSYTDGTQKTAASDSSGNYSFQIPSNWSGTVTPSKTGVTFTPANRTYTGVAANKAGENYTLVVTYFTISGNAGVAGAALSYTDGTQKTAASDSSGNYSFQVPANWSGTVTPSKTGVSFTPANRTYASVAANMTAQNYTLAVTYYTISGNAGVAGAALSYTDGTQKTAASDSSGNYSFQVPANWSGTVTPSKTGISFTPANRTYTSVTTNMTGENYTLPVTYITISGNTGVAKATLSYSDGTQKTVAADRRGNYSFQVPGNWSGTVTPSKTGAAFTPANRTYAGVAANMTGQNYRRTSSSFADVSFTYSESLGGVSYSLYPYIQALYDADYTAGCGSDPLTYCPSQDLNRAESSVFMLRATNDVTYTPSASLQNTFPADDWGSGAWAQSWAEDMYQSGLTAGCSTNPLKFCPWDSLTRDEASVFGLRIKYGMGYTPPPATGRVFADMTDANLWSTAWAEQAYADGLLTACGYRYNKPKFCPNGQLDRAWTAYLIVNALDLPIISY